MPWCISPRPPWSPFPAPCPFPTFGIPRRYSTASHPLLPTAADQPLQHPPPIPLPSPSIQASLLHAAIPHPLYPTTYLLIEYHAYTCHTYLPTLLSASPHEPRPPSRRSRPSFFNRNRSSCTPRHHPRRLKASAPLAFHSQHHLLDGIMGIMETSACRSSVVRDPCHETLVDHLVTLSTPQHPSTLVLSCPDTISRCTGIPILLNWEIAPPQTSSSDCPPAAPPPDRRRRSSIISP